MKIVNLLLSAVMASTMIVQGAAFDAQAAEEQAETAKSAYRQWRQTECFPVINRGRLWYDTLTEEQLSELKTWYRAWLDGTNTQTIPEKPEWLT